MRAPRPEMLRIGVRTVEEILREVPVARGKGATGAVALPADFIARGAKLKSYQFAEDYRFYSLKDARTKFAKREHPKAGLFVKHLPFAETGQGDIWCIRAASARSSVSFLDHGEAVRALPQDLRISFDQWLQLADLAAQVDRASVEDPTLMDAKYRLKPRWKKLVQHELEKIAHGLSKRVPIACW